MKNLSVLFVGCGLFLAACTPTGNPPAELTLSAYPSLVATMPVPTVFSSSTQSPVVLPLTPSVIPTHSLELLKGKLPSVTPTHGFVILEMTQSVPVDGILTVTIFTASGADCQIQYVGPGGLSHAAGLEPQIADANGVCSWAWKQSMGNKLATGTGRITITANDEWEIYDVVVK